MTGNRTALVVEENFLPRTIGWADTTYCFLIVADYFSSGGRMQYHCRVIVADNGLMILISRRRPA